MEMLQQKKPETVEYVEMLKQSAFGFNVFNLSNEILHNILHATPPSSESVERLIDAMGAPLESYFQTHLQGLNINDTDDKYKLELEVVQLDDTKRQYFLNGNGKSDRYLSALFFNNAKTFNIEFPGLVSSVELKPETVLFLPVCMTYRFKVSTMELPLSALCVHAKICYRKE